MTSATAGRIPSQMAAPSFRRHNQDGEPPEQACQIAAYGYGLAAVAGGNRGLPQHAVLVRLDLHLRVAVAESTDPRHLVTLVSATVIASQGRQAEAQELLRNIPDTVGHANNTPNGSTRSGSGDALGN